MARETLEPALDEIQASSPRNLYLPHEWYSSSPWRWLYAIKKQPHVGTWTFILVREDVRIFESKEARDAEIIRLEQLEQVGAQA